MACASSLTQRSIRPHRKSRTGCSTCKRRKVKCDENKPCSNCRSFGIPCDLVPENERLDCGTGKVTGRGRGRPRKTWTVADPLRTASPCSGTTSAPSPPAAGLDLVPINVDHAELLVHFITSVAETLAGEGQGMHKFWTCNASQIGLSHTFLLRLIFASAAFHLAYQVKKESVTDGDPTTTTLRRPRHRSRSDYLSLAQQHLAAGLSGFSAQLSQAGPENCGALFLASVLTSYCTFAAGPMNPDDLLVCTASGGDARGSLYGVSSTASSMWMPFVYGVRLMHQSFSPDVLFAGLMGPFKEGSSDACLEKPVYARDGFPRLDWEVALNGLRGFIAETASHEDTREVAMVTPQFPEAELSNEAICLHELDCLIEIYAATYGCRGPKDEVTYSGPSVNQFIFGWLYRLEREFVACVTRREPCALLVLAHYAVLLNGDAIRKGWFMDGWREHIIARVGYFLLEDEYRKWMRWPVEQVRHGEEGAV